MLFSTKKHSQNNINTFLPVFSTTKNSSHFLIIKKLYKIQKQTSRKNTLIAKMKTPYFLFYFKQWLLYTQKLNKHKNTKTLLITHPKLQISKKIKLNFLLKPKNTKTGFISNFNVQKKEQFRTALNKNENFDFVSINNLKNTKPNAFLFIQPLQNEPALKETKQKQFAISSIENLTNTTISEFPLFFNSFKHKNSLDELLIQNKNTIHKQHWINNLRKLFLFSLFLTKKIHTKYKIKKNKNSLQINTLKLKKWIINLWKHHELRLMKTKRFKHRSWNKLILKMSPKKIKINRKSKKLLRLVTITKQNFKKTIPQSTSKINTIFYNNRLQRYCFPNNLKWILSQNQKIEKKNRFKFFFQRLNNLKYLQKAYLWNLIKEPTLLTRQLKTNTNEFSQWMLLPLITKNLTYFNNEKFSFSNFNSYTKKLYKKIKTKTKQQKNLFKKMPNFVTLWQANQLWLESKDKKTRHAAELYKQLNGKFPTWWEFPIKNYKDLYIRNRK